jgi:hypothetical protein
MSGIPPSLRSIAERLSSAPLASQPGLLLGLPENTKISPTTRAESGRKLEYIEKWVNLQQTRAMLQYVWTTRQEAVDAKPRPTKASAAGFDARMQSMVAAILGDV